MLLLGVVYRGLTLPLVWAVLAKDGNSNSQERKALMKQLLWVVPAQQIQCLVADREFSGQGCWWWLKLQQIKFCIRIKGNAGYTQGRYGQVKHLFNPLAIGQYDCLSQS